MPEGDTIYRTAERLRTVLAKRRIDAARSRGDTLRAESLIGRTVVAVEARGKHLLIHLDAATVIHSHLGMWGSWHIYAPGQPWRKPAAHAELVLQAADAVCVCFHPLMLELLSPTDVRRHRHLRRLGPDILNVSLDEPVLVRRFRVQPAVPIGQALMDQTIVCGIGNIYKSETLFLARVNPFMRVAELSDATVAQVIRRAHELMRSNLGGQPRRTRRSLRGPRLWVYGRTARPCLVCGCRIQMRRQGDMGRTTYWCPHCQAPVR